MCNSDITCGMVILNYNDFLTTSHLLNTIKGYKSIEHIVVVDNHSTDDSYKQLKKLEDEHIEVILAPQNGGYSSGNNIGIRYLMERYHIDILGISNSDVEFEESFITKIKSDYLKMEEYSIITGMQIAPDGEIATHPFWEIEDANSYLQKKWRELFCRNVKRYKRYIEQKLSVKDEIIQVGAVEGSLFFINAKDFEKVGYFDENVFIYMEEDILGTKISKINKKAGVDRSINYIHYGAKTTDIVFTTKAKIKYVCRSNIYYFEHYLSNNKFLHLINRILCYLISCRQYIIFGIRKNLKTYRCRSNNE